MKLKDLLSIGKQELKKADLDTYSLDAELILSELLKCERSELFAKAEEDIDVKISDEFKVCIVRRSKGEPTAYITGKKGFYKHEFIVCKDVLVPRPETELIVEYALEYVDKLSAKTIVDLGCGSGCIGLSILADRDKVKGVFVDRSSAALEIAKKNANLLKLMNASKFLHKDVAHLSRFDLNELEFELPRVIVANPPYIAEGSSEVAENVKKYEPRTALFSGPQGTEHVVQWSKVAYELLANPGVFICEIGYDQKEPLLATASQSGHWSHAEILQDLAGRDRILVLKKEE